jgi:tRNA threonylcarbamoyl adenosine modification protein YeaZ
VIGFDCATDEVVVAACDGDEPSFETRIPPDSGGRPAHSRALLPAIDDAAASLGGWESVDRIAVGIGPGTFTGLRIAASTAAGLALSTGLAVVGVSTLEALAGSLVESGGTSFPVLDARRGEVFLAAFDRDGVQVVPPGVMPPAEAARSVLATGGEVTVGGPGAVRFAGLFAEAGITVADPESGAGRLSGTDLCRLGVSAPLPESGQTPQPLYIREPDAKLWLERDNRATG